LFNHESPRRGETFVSRKITLEAAQIALGKSKCLYLGNINAKRDWGHAKEYVEVMWRMLQQEKPEDYVIATGEAHTVREFVEVVFDELGIPIKWQGEGTNEIGINSKTGEVIVRIDPYFYRPSEVEILLGDATKARRELGWYPKIRFEELAREMARFDFKEAQLKR